MTRSGRSATPEEKAFVNSLVKAGLLLLIVGQAAAGYSDSGIWGHMSIGLDMLNGYQFLWIDPYSFTSDQAWINHEWLWDVVSAAVYRAGGLPAIVYGTKSDEKYVLGRANTILGVVRTINLNSKEKTGIDADLGFQGVERVDLQMGRGNDEVDSTGGTGTGNLTMDTPLIVNGEDGNDIIVGGTGPDALFGGPGSDTLVGKAGNDLLFTQDGVNGNDNATGNAGDDDCGHVDPGDSCVP